jgi:hypothetical protein
MSPASGDGAVLIGALTQRGYTLGQNLTYEGDPMGEPLHVGCGS